MEKWIALAVVKTVWFFTYLLPVRKQKITFISYFETKLAGSFKQIKKELEQADESLEMVFLIRKFQNTLSEKAKALLDFVGQTYHINTSSVVVLDGNNFPVCNMRKKKKTTVVQIWHASGGIKKFGNDIERERYKIRNYDYVYAAGEVFRESYASAFNVPKNKVMPLGIAKTDLLYKPSYLQSRRREMEEAYPVLKGKHVVLYAPTFRGDGAFDLSYVDLDVEALQKQLGEDTVVIYKMHPFLNQVGLHNRSHQVINGNDIGLYRLFSVADVLISDYSAIIFDFSILEKPIVLYTPDLEKYERERGFYFDYKTLAPGPICKTEEEIVQAIDGKTYDTDKVKAMKHRFFDHHDGKSAKRIAEHILAEMKGK
ncbi:MAG TPA: CDP-glycerol--glycerophosphate glycerophosphotransferase [Eubacteriaceae bacterium]|nr:CDP-glycerol--glycerophosphate glycerophosphotransferase [Eubacteriaceae bacterium]